MSEPDTLMLTTHCPFCGAPGTITVAREDYDRWKAGVHAQRAFPDLSPSERELVMTGTCDPCWDTTFGGD